MKKVLLTGANGLLGHKLLKLLCAKGYSVIACSKGPARIQIPKGAVYFPLDITNKSEVKALLGKELPDVVVNCAAMTNVDGCEDNKEECWQVNVEAIATLSELCTQLHFHLVHISTDFIFDGLKTAPYTEVDNGNPVSYYGKSKWEAEKIIQSLHQERWAIARTVLVYGVSEGFTRSNVVLWVKNNLEQNKPITVVNDQIRSPTLVEDLAMGCLLIIEKEAKGIYNISGPDSMNILALAHQVARVFDLNERLISPISSRVLNQRAKRPVNTPFDLKKSRKELNFRPHSFKEGLELVKKQLKI